MVRVAPVVAALVVAASGAAAAGPTHRIRVETTPEKAHVYIDNIESGAKCEATPCEFEAPVGEISVIIQLEKYEPLFESVDVKASRNKKPQVFAFELKPAIAAIVCEDPKAKGASVQIDGHDKGKCPGKIEIEPGAYQVVVKLGNK